MTRLFVPIFGLVAVLLCIATHTTANTLTKDEMMNSLKVYNVTLPANLKPGYVNWRVWGAPKITTRLFNAPLASGNLLVGWTDAKDTGHVSYLTKNNQTGYTLERDITIAGRQLRGLVATEDSSFAVLGWVSGGNMSKMYVQKWSAIERSSTASSRLWETELVAGDNYPHAWNVGDSRMNYDGRGEYRAYYHVHSPDGHEGDAYFRVNATTGTPTTVWNWGCSHSMSNLLSYHPVLNTTISLCVTDCYPGTSGAFATNAIGGLYTDGRSLLQLMNAGCNGRVAGEVGMIVPIYNESWAVIFNGHRKKAEKGASSYSTKTHNQDVGIAFINKTGMLAGSVKWLTDTRADEADPGLARYGAFCSGATCKAFGQSDHVFLTGWKRGADRFLAFLLSNGEVRAGPYNVTRLEIDGVETTVSWGARDDTWRTLSDGSVAWLEAPNDTGNMLRVFVMEFDANKVKMVNQIFTPLEIAVLVLVFGVFPLYIIIAFSVVAIIKKKRGESICGSSESAAGAAKPAAPAAEAPAQKPAAAQSEYAPPPVPRNAPPKTPPRSGGRSKPVRD